MAASLTRLWTFNFNPRTSYEVRLRLPRRDVSERDISIHAPLTRCDWQIHYIILSEILFQSTHLLRGATSLMSQ